MAFRRHRITLLGNNSGRNLGDAAILAGILDIFTKKNPNISFYVPSILPKFINDNYGSRYNVKGVNIMPWTLSIRLFGLPTLYCMAKSEIALICDGIIFGRKLFSPHNFLITLILLIPWAKLLRCKIVCYCCGIGPFPSKLSETIARCVINSADLVIMRDHDSKQLAKNIGVKKPIEVAGDAAFLNRVSDDNRARRIAEDEGLDLSIPIMGLNITRYLDGWLEKSERLKDKSDFLSIIAGGIIQAATKLAEDDNNGNNCPLFQTVIFSASPMDEQISFDLASLIGGKVIDNSKYLSHDIQSIMRRCELLVGMRFHSLVLAAAVGVPVVGLIYAPKVRGFMRLLNCEEYGIELYKLTTHILCDKLVAAWKGRSSLKTRQQKISNELAIKAEVAADKIKERYFTW